MIDEAFKEKTWKDVFPKENRYFETDNGILYCGDCLDIMTNFPETSIDLIITDPPYGVNSNEMNGIDYKDKFYNVKEVSKTLYMLLKENSRAFIFTAQKTFITVVKNFEKSGFKLHQTLIWYRPNLAGGTLKKTYDFTSVYEQILNFHKGNPLAIKKIGYLNNFDVFKYAQPQSNFKNDTRFHIHQKPLNLIEHLLLVSSNKNELVLDSFAGSGTTLIASENLERKWIGIEINEEYCEIIKKRLFGSSSKIKIF